MARPPIEWPIPVYVVELRERLILSYRVRAGVLQPRVPAPLIHAAGAPGVVSLCIGNGRCVKTVGGPPTLAHDFHVAELLTPVLWERACRAPKQGQFLLRLLTDSPGLRRLVRAAVGMEALRVPMEQRTERGRLRCRIGAAGAGWDLQPEQELRWPVESLYPDAEAAEAHLLHPECYFIPDEENPGVVRAVEVHPYARSTVQAPAVDFADGIVAAALGCSPRDLALDHVLLQKRCTHTWFFPPERISIAGLQPRSLAQLLGLSAPEPVRAAA